MSPSIFSCIPNPEALLALEPEELAGYFMAYLHALPAHERRQIHPSNTVSTQALTTLSGNWPLEYKSKIQEYAPRISKALMEAWMWLAREGLLAHDPEPGSQ